VELEETSETYPEVADNRNELSTYHLARDRQMREINPPSRHVQADLVSYALYTAT